MKKLFLAAAITSSLGVALTGAALAQMDHSMHGGATETPATPSVTAYKAAMDKMHADMAKQEYTGNADVDFVRGMIPHHQGAIDMAKIELDYGKDETLRKLAQDIIAAQEAEITVMKDWLAKNGG